MFPKSVALLLFSMLFYSTSCDLRLLSSVFMTITIISWQLSVSTLVSSSRYGFSKSVQIPRLFCISWLIEQFASSETKCLSLFFLCWTLFFCLFYFPSPLAILQYYCRGRGVWSPVSGNITSWWRFNGGLCWPHWVEIWSQCHSSPVFYH